MAYEKQTWIDGKSPLNAERLNHIEEGLANLVASVNGVAPDENGNVEITVSGSGVNNIELDTTLTVAGAAADAKAVGDALDGKMDAAKEVAITEYVDNAVAQKAQEQLIIWEAND